MKNTKICSVCNLEKSFDDFHNRKDSEDGKRNDCKKCTRERINKYRVENKEKVNKWNQETYYRNHDSHKSTKKKYREKTKDQQKIRTKNWRDNNKEKIKKYEVENKLHLNKMALIRLKKRKLNDKLFSLICSVRARFNGFLKKNNISKKNKTFDIVGCTPEFLREYIEQKFTEGMSWDNYGRNGWHVDHIIPLSSAKNESEIYELCHYTNLQPLWESENIKKSNKIL